jgi:lipopolysaccharide export system protein LptC
MAGRTVKVLTNLLQRYGPSAVMLALGLISFWALNLLDLDLSTPAGDERHTPDFYVENFVSTSMNEHGAVQRRVEAEYMAHFPDTDTHEFQQPYMVMYPEKAPPWHARSERGWLSASGDVLLLLGKVHIWRNNANGVKELDIKTEDLRVLPESEYGETDKHVLITTPTSQTRGIGMKAHMSESRFELLSNVHTRHEPVKK